MSETIDVQCWHCKRDGKGTYRTRSYCANCGWEGIAIHSLGHGKDGCDDCPHCECRAVRHEAVLAQPAQHVQPLVELEADVPLPWRLEGVSDAQVAVTLSVGDLLLIDSEGLVCNGSGSPIFRLVREEAKV